MSISHENGQISLYDVACFYVNQGWSVIPLCGDSRPDRPKSPLISWKVYQQKTAATHEIAGWFEELAVGALGIVCGAVSRLLVLDFDDSDMADAFAQMLPDLTRTFTVRSGKRGLPHYYYRVASGTELFSKHFSGVDLLWNGTYVVAPPSVIADSAWKVVCDVHPVELAHRDVARIQAFLEAYAYQADERDTVKEALSLFERQVSGSLGTDRYSDAAMCRWYGELAVRHGRNEALFRVACLMRDRGHSRDAVVEVLEPLHAVQPALGPHHAETVEQRRREAVRTIYSVFARPPRVRSFVTTTGGLPNTAREALLKQGLVSVARVVDGLLLLGGDIGQPVTESDLCELLQPCGIGRRTVQNALKAVLEGGESIFQDLGKGYEAPLDPPIQPHAYAETYPKIDRTKCFFVRVTKRVRTGCPPIWYKVPTVSALCRMLKVSASSSDALTRDDLANAKTYRMALQRQLFRRRPGQYSRRWLAKRLGITIRTCQRYDHEAGYSARPMFRETLMAWADARALPGAV
ncbi:MAG: bifunctional DNA primase/polymerase, partial [Anaerolineae bacterium]|nr:bifunctional DNA primase/polymerase [Anaerolineae bacterium]